MSIITEGAAFPTPFKENQFNTLGSSVSMLPDSALVQVTELSSNGVNPTPKRLSSSDGFFEEYIGEQKLKDLTGKEDLSSVTFLEIKIDVGASSCGNFGSLLPNLRELRLIKSNVPALRDLGSSLDNLEILWMPRSCLQCLDGLSGMSNLVELYLAFNELKEISACAMLELLEVLDLEGNHISEKSNISYLRVCGNLTNLTLEGNPIVSEMGGIKKYRKAVRKALPQLCKLDDIPIETDVAPKSAEYDINKFDNEWNYINTLLKEVGLISESSLATGVSQIDKPSNAADDTPDVKIIPEEETMKPGRAGSGLRPKSGQLRLSTANECRKLSPKFDPSRTIQRPATASTYMINEATESEETTSRLTTGRVVCGGIGGALRSRRGSAKSSVLHPTGSDAVSSSYNAVIFSRPKSNETTTTEYDNAIPSMHRNETGTLDIKQKLVTTVGEKQPVKPSKKDKTNKKKVKKKQSIDPSSADVILQEEEQLRVECDAVLKELSDWRKTYSEFQMFHTRKSVPQILKVHPAEKDTDAILFSTDSESTVEERSGASTRSNRAAPSRSLTPGGRESNIDEECPSEVSNPGGYEGQRKTTAGADCVESPHKSDANKNAKVHLCPTTDAVNQNVEYNDRHAFSSSTEPKPPRASENIAKKNTFAQGSTSSETKPKSKPSNDGLLPGQSSNLHTQQSGTKRNGRATFPPVMSISPRAVASSFSKGSTNSCAPVDAYRPRLAMSFQTNHPSGQHQTPGGDVRHKTKSSPYAPPSTSSILNRPGPKGLANRLETAGHLTSKLSGSVPSPLPSKPTVHPKV